MNPDTTVFIPLPVSEKPERTIAVIFLKENSQWPLHAVYEITGHPINEVWEGYTHWLKPVKLSEITRSQPVSEWQLCPKCKGDVCWQDTIVDGQNISLTACTMCKGEGKILPPAQPVKSNEDIVDELCNKITPGYQKQVDYSISLELQIDILVRALEECDEYLSQHHFEKGKPVYLNNIGANSILHKKMQQALSSCRTSVEPEYIKVPCTCYCHTSKALALHFVACCDENGMVEIPNPKYNRTSVKGEEQEK